MCESSHSRGFYENEDIEEIYTGLRAQDLQETKDQLVVETADMLVKKCQKPFGINNFVYNLFKI